MSASEAATSAEEPRAQSTLVRRDSSPSSSDLAELMPSVLDGTSAARPPAAKALDEQMKALGIHSLDEPGSNADGGIMIDGFVVPPNVLHALKNIRSTQGGANALEQLAQGDHSGLAQLLHTSTDQSDLAGPSKPNGAARQAKGRGFATAADSDPVAETAIHYQPLPASEAAPVPAAAVTLPAAHSPLAFGCGGEHCNPLPEPASPGAASFSTSHGSSRGRSSGRGRSSSCGSSISASGRSSAGRSSTGRSSTSSSGSRGARGYGHIDNYSPSSQDAAELEAKVAELTERSTENAAVIQRLTTDMVSLGTTNEQLQQRLALLTSQLRLRDSEIEGLRSDVLRLRTLVADIAAAKSKPRRR